MELLGISKAHKIASKDKEYQPVNARVKYWSEIGIYANYEVFIWKKQGKLATIAKFIGKEWLWASNLRLKNVLMLWAVWKICEG